MKTSPRNQPNPSCLPLPEVDSKDKYSERGYYLTVLLTLCHSALLPVTRKQPNKVNPVEQ